MFLHFQRIEKWGQACWQCVPIYHAICIDTHVVRILQCVIIKALHWRHNDHDDVWNHQPHGCLLICLFRLRSKKTSKLRVTSLCVGIHRDRWIPRTKGQLRGKYFDLMTSSWLSAVLRPVVVISHYGRKQRHNSYTMKYEYMLLSVCELPRHKHGIHGTHVRCNMLRCPLHNIIYTK